MIWAISTIAFLRRNIKACPAQTTERANKTYVLPTTENASTVLSPHTENNVQAVKMSQRRAARFVMGNYRRTSSVRDMMSHIQWESVTSVTLTLIPPHHDVWHCKPSAWHSCYPYLQPASARTRGHTMRLRQIQAFNSSYNGCFFPQTVILWNKLPKP